MSALVDHGPKRDGAPIDRTDAADTLASEELVVWIVWDVTAVSVTSGLRKTPPDDLKGREKCENSQGPR